MGIKLTAKQVRAIEALLSERTIADAAVAAGVGEASLYRWLNDPAFDKAYKSARSRLLETTLTRLQHVSSDAVKTLHETLTDPLAQAPARVSAARTILEFSLKAREALELDDRLSALEEVLLAGKKTT
ncbi:MAG: hypothetical protein HYR56_16960 [Acidobacteria bacterium]|nr:hypothetical protein [Acidobacteriota bacterium]MBI3428010.1 hypothetical protein [Acidobacteriota bacterium]